MTTVIKVLQAIILYTQSNTSGDNLNEILGKNKKHISNLSSADLAKRVVKK